MNIHQVPEVVPLDAPAIAEALPVRARRPTSTAAASDSALLAVIRWPFAWGWRIFAGAFLCFAGYVLSIIVVGWFYRWMQATVLRGFWKRSPQRVHGSFEAFCASLGHDAPVARPRWFLKERMRDTLRRAGPDGRPPSSLRVAARAVKLPLGSLWRNLKIGFLGLLATFLLLGPGCLIMIFGWEFGWLVAFDKVYEQGFIGLAVSLPAIGLFVTAMFYVPMAQVHQAVTGEFRAFFDFRFVWRLIQARLTAYMGLIALLAVLSAVFVEVAKTAPGFFWNNAELQDHGDAKEQMEILVDLASAAQRNPALEEEVAWREAELGVSRHDAATRAEEHRLAVLKPLNQYLFTCSVGLFLAWLLTRRVAAAVYRSAVVKVLERGRVARADLHPTLARWFERLGLNIIPAAELPGFVEAVRGSSAWLYRKFAYTLIAIILFLWVSKTYVGEFLNYHPVSGFGNHALVQFPTFGSAPGHLQGNADFLSAFAKK
jgi:hypothetical protein